MRVLLEFENWPEWLVSMRITNVLRTGEEQAVIDLAMEHGIIKIQLKLEVKRSGENSFAFRRVSGWLKHFSSEWTLTPYSQGSGTMLAISTEAEGGLFVPKSLIYHELGEHFEEWARALDLRARSFIPSEEIEVDTEEVIPTEVAKILQAFQTEKGLEIWLLGKRYLVKKSAR